ncbi:hypothetical protein M8J76_007270 [Diaphorina citri]|nr:hypothetical protein M8J76_007270 [Diaphorina citri]
MCPQRREKSTKLPVAYYLPHSSILPPPPPPTTRPWHTESVLQQNMLHQVTKLKPMRWFRLFPFFPNVDVKGTATEYLLTASSTESK